MNVKKIFFVTLALAVMSAIMVSCEMGAYPGFKKASTGVYYKIYSQDNNDTTAIRKGSIVTMSLKYGLKDSTLFDSHNVPEPIVLQVTEPQYPGDFYESLMLFKEGDSATFILKAGPLFTKTFHQPKVPDFITDDSDVYFDVDIKKVQTQEEKTQEDEARNKQLEQDEITNLGNYIKDNNIIQEPDTNGIYYIEIKRGTGKAPVKDGYVTANYTVTLLDGTKLFSTYDKGEPIDFKYGSQFENKGFMDVIGKMREGGKAEAIVPSAMAFGAKGAGKVVPPFSTLHYNIEMVKVLTNDQYNQKRADEEAKKAAEGEKRNQEEAAIIQKYMKDNNLTPTQTLPSGLVYIQTEAGQGPKPTDGEKVKVKYTGKLLNGTVFDSSDDHGGDPYEFTLGRHNVIEGWDQGIALMNEGGKATLIIPSKLAYKDRPMGDKIPANSILLFDVELVKVEK